MPREWRDLADELAPRAIAEGRPTEWFDELYAAGASGSVTMPWDREGPNPMLAEWSQRLAAPAADGTAIVVGCGLGADAEFVASLGYATTAFDLSPTAIRVVRERRPDSPVNYRHADLLDLPNEWTHAFDLVVEIYTAQSMPDPPRSQAIPNIAQLVAPGGRLVVIALAEGPAREPGPPFPLRRDEIQSFAVDGVQLAELDEIEEGPYWRAEFTRAAGSAAARAEG